jgi:hypothetical protein
MNDAILRILRDIYAKICAAASKKIDPEVVCISNDGGATIIKGVIEFDTTTTPSTKILYLLDGTLATGYVVVPCEGKTFDTEFRDVCVDGQTWTQILVFDKTVSLTSPSQIGWMNASGTNVSAPDPSLINNVNCQGCISSPQGVLLSWGT